MLSSTSVKQIPVRSGLQLQLLSRMSQIWLPVDSKSTDPQIHRYACMHCNLLGNQRNGRVQSMVLASATSACTPVMSLKASQTRGAALCMTQSHLWLGRLTGLGACTFPRLTICLLGLEHARAVSVGTATNTLPLTFVCMLCVPGSPARDHIASGRRITARSGLLRRSQGLRSRAESGPPRSSFGNKDKY